jgi:hypothetical protein
MGFLGLGLSFPILVLVLLRWQWGANITELLWYLVMLGWEALLTWQLLVLLREVYAYAARTSSTTDRGIGKKVQRVGAVVACIVEAISLTVCTSILIYFLDGGDVYAAVMRKVVLGFALLCGLAFCSIGVFIVMRSRKRNVYRTG